MARADTATLIPLDRVARHLQIDPWHFNGIVTPGRPERNNCDDMWFQYGWLSTGRLSREDLAFALKQAEDMVIRHLNWSPLPVWVSEDLQITPHHQVELNSFYNPIGKLKTVETTYGYVTAVGQRATTLIDTPSTIFSDTDGDGFNETVTVTVATTVTDEEELRVYYPGKSAADRWEIRPVTSITISGGTATIVFPKYLIVKENLITNPPGDPDRHVNIDGSDDTNFLATVDVYRVYNDPSEQATFHYPPTSDCTGDCDGTTNTGCLYIKNKRLGVLAYNRADWDADTAAFVTKSFTAFPEKVTVRYRAGWADDSLDYPTRQMTPTLERMISYYALSMLDRELCGCANTVGIWELMTRDLSKVTPDKSYVLPWNVLGNPFGTSYAAIQLWKHVQYLRLQKSPLPR